MPKIIGYARVSTSGQDPASQRAKLKANGCDRIFVDHGVGGLAKARPQLEKALASLGEGDVLVVYRLDRLGRSLSDLIRTVGELEARGVGFRSLSESIDTTSAGGRLIFHVMGALAEFERSLIVERTRAGLEAAKDEGRRLGRPRRLTKRQLHHAVKLIQGGERVERVARTLEVSYSTLRRGLLREGLG